MIVLFVILDILIFSLVIIAVFFLVRKIMEIREKEKPPIENDLEEFRNEELYEESREKMKQYAHIEEMVRQESPGQGRKVMCKCWKAGFSRG